MDLVRAEREALTDANLKTIEMITSSKQALVEEIHRVENLRLKLVTELALLWKRPFKELTLTNIIIKIQGYDPKGADQLRSTYNTLTILIQRITDQNNDNKALIEKSLDHIHSMKKNILSEATSKSNTYTQQGQKSSTHPSSRLISREA
jgi:flagellar biosynthesis/type III secretory pathway chaperone